MMTKIIYKCKKAFRINTRVVFLLIIVAIPFVIYAFLHPSSAEAAWFNDSWYYRIKLTVDHTKVGADQTDFPVYVDLSLLPAQFHQYVNQTDARDIRITSSDGATELPREVVYYNSTTHTGELHFKYTGTLSSSTDTTVYIYYGNAGASDYAASDTYGKNNVWDSNYSGVHHVQNSSFSDSTSGAHNGTNNDSTNASGHAGDGRLMDADCEYFSVPMSGYVHASVNTFEWWYKSATTTPAAYPSFFNSSEGSDQLTFSKSGSNTTLNLNLNSTNYLDWSSLATNVFDGGWHHIVVALDTVANTEDLYIDGTNRGQKTQNPANIDISTYNLLWGGNTCSAPVEGIIDEARVSSNILRSATWISTTYNNQNSPSTFFTASKTEEQKGRAVLNFTFDEGYGTTVHDSSPNGYIGTLSGATTPAWINEDQCMSGKCLYYNGSTAYTSVTTSVPNVQSVSFWVKPKTNGETLVDFDGGTHYITASSGTITASGFSTPTVYVNGVSGGLLIANAWQHVEVTTATAFTASNITIGKKTAFLNGFVDEFKVYDYARTAAQVKLGFNSRNSQSGVAARFGPDTGNTLSNGLVGYWKMDEASWATNCSTLSVLDSSGNSNNAAPCPNASAATLSTGKFGSAGSFDGTNDYLNIANNSSLKPTQQVTVSSWFYHPADSTKTSVTLFRTANGASDQEKLFAAGPNSSTLYPSFYLSLTNAGAATCQPTTATLPLGAWSHLTGTYDGNTIRVYLNGNLTGACSYPNDTLAHDTNPLWIGAINPGSGFTYGKIDDLRVYNRALSPAEVGPLYNWAPGPVGYWKMDENTGTVGNDFSGNGFSLEVPDNNFWTAGKFGSATQAKIDGLQSGLFYNDTSTATTDLLDFSNTQDFSYTFWYKSSSAENTSVIPFHKGAGSTSTIGYNWEINSSGDAKCKYTDGDGSGDDRTSATLSVWNDDMWHHVECVMNRAGGNTANDGFYMYIDGVLMGSDTSLTEGSAAASAVDLKLGEYSATYEYEGGVDDVKIYNYARTPAQVIEDMNGGHPAPGSPVGSSVAYWKFDEGALATCPATAAATASIARVQYKHQYTATSGTGYAFASNNTLHNFIVVFVSGAGTATSMSFSDTQGNTYTPLTLNDAGGPYSQIFYAADINAGANSITSTYSGWSDVGFTAVEYSGIATSSPLDVEATPRQISGGSTFTSNSFNPTVSGDLIFAGWANEQNDSSSLTCTGSDMIQHDTTHYDANCQILSGSTGSQTLSFSGGTALGTNLVNVAAFKAESSSSTPADYCDSSINANHLDFSTTTGGYTNSGKFGKAFDGTGAVWASRANDPDLDFGATEDFTLSGWFKSDSATNPANGTEYILSTSTGNTDVGYQVYAKTTGVICFAIDDDGTWTDVESCTTADYYDGAWHHFTAVRNVTTDTTKIYIDAVEKDSDTDPTTATLDGDNVFYLGDFDGDNNATAGIEEFAGDVDEVKIFRSALSPDAIKVLYNQNSASVMGALSTDASNNPSNSSTDSYCPPGQGSVCVPPIAHFKLDENTGTTSVFDSSTNNFTGTMFGSKTNSDWVSGKFGSGLKFDGVNDGVDFYSAGFNSLFSPTSGTLSLWWRYPNSNQWSAAGTPNAINIAADTNNLVTIRRDTTNIQFLYVAGGTVETSSITTQPTDWVHLTMTWDKAADKVSYYYNGIFQQTDTVLGTWAGSLASIRVVFGARTTGAADPFDGQLDNIQIYNYVRSPAQIAWDYNQGKPVGWWKLDENTGTSANDSMGNSTAGILTNTPTWVAGKFNYATSFAGSNQHILIADDDDFDFADDEDITLTTWFKHTTASAQEIIMSKYAAAGYKIVMESDGDITCGLDYDSTWTPTDSTTSTLATYDDGNWHHIACVKTGATSLSLYIDGLLIGTDSSLTATNTLTNADPLYFGINANGTSNDFTGSLDDVRIYRYPLTPQQIKTVMNEGAVRFVN